MVDAVLPITPRIQYVAGVGQTIYAYPFPILSDVDIVVDIDGVVQTLTTDYTVDGVGNETGGNVTLVVATTGGEIVTLYRETVLQRLQDYQQNGDFLSVDVNTDFDRLWLALQEGSLDITRAIRVDINDTATDLVLPGDREDKIISFDATGNVVLYDRIIDPGEVNTASNLGAGEGVFAQKVGVDLEFKSLVAGTNINLVSDADTITMNAILSVATINSPLSVVGDNTVASGLNTSLLELTDSLLAPQLTLQVNNNVADLTSEAPLFIATNGDNDMVLTRNAGTSLAIGLDAATFTADKLVINSPTNLISAIEWHNASAKKAEAGFTSSVSGSTSNDFCIDVAQITGSPANLYIKAGSFGGSNAGDLILRGGKASNPQFNGDVILGRDTETKFSTTDDGVAVWGTDNSNTINNIANIDFYRGNTGTVIGQIGYVPDHNGFFTMKSLFSDIKMDLLAGDDLLIFVNDAEVVRLGTINTFVNAVNFNGGINVGSPLDIVGTGTDAGNDINSQLLFSDSTSATGAQVGFFGDETFVIDNLRGPIELQQNGVDLLRVESGTIIGAIGAGASGSTINVLRLFESDGTTFIGDLGFVGTTDMVLTNYSTGGVINIDAPSGVALQESGATKFQTDPLGARVLSDSSSPSTSTGVLDFYNSTSVLHMGRLGYIGDGALYIENVGGGNGVIINHNSAIRTLTTTASGPAFTGNITPSVNGGGSCGTAGLQWTDIFAISGSVNTSDEKMKKNIHKIDDAFLDAWEEVDHTFFEWVDGTINDKINVGVVAQQIEECFRRHNLDAFAFGLIRMDEMDGEMCYSIRPDQCHFAEAALLRREVKRMKEQLLN